MDRQHHDKTYIVMDREVKKKGTSMHWKRAQGAKYKDPRGGPLSPGFIHSPCLSEGQRVDMKVFSKL